MLITHIYKFKQYLYFSFIYTLFIHLIILLSTKQVEEFKWKNITSKETLWSSGREKVYDNVITCDNWLSIFFEKAKHVQHLNDYIDK